MKKQLLLLLVCWAIMAPTVMAAEVERNETVYVSLDNHGRPADIQVVTWLRGETGQATWVDYGSYDQVQSSNADLAPTIGDGTISWPASALQGEGLFYQGKSDKELPFSIAIDYSLDGRPIEPQDLAGKSGQVTIRLHAENHLQQQQTISYRDYHRQEQDSQQALYTPLVMQISQSLPVGTWTDIRAEGATRVLVGDQLRLSWALFPYPDADFTLEMRGQTISLAPMEITVLPMMPALTSMDMTAEVTQLAAGVDQLTDSLQRLATAAGDLAAGQNQLAAGGQQLAAGLSELTQALQAAEAGSKALMAGLDELESSHRQLAQMGHLLQQSADPTLQAIAAGLQAEQQALRQLIDGGQALTDGLSASAAALAGISTEASGLFAAADQSAAGQQALAQGLLALDSQGLTPLREQAIGQYATLQAGVATTAAMEQLVRNQHSFVDNSRNQTGQVQYLLRTAGVEPPVEERPTATPPAKLTLWQRIVRWFTGK